MTPTETARAKISKARADQLCGQLKLLLAQARNGGNRGQPTMIAVTAEQAEHIIALMC